MVHLMAFLAPVVAPYHPEQINLLRRFAPLSAEHLLGTDENGRDVLSRLMYGGRVSLGVGFASVLAAMTVGTMLGGIAGYFGGVIVAATLGVAYAILTESALSSLGLGVRPPTPSWGNMLSSARSYLWTAPHLAIFPGLLILLTVLAYNSLGDGLRDALSS
jgi:ABC-type dipeptide/oligopeptide/nickel transport system permease subunit